MIVKVGLARSRRKRRAVDDVEIVDLVRAAPSVKHRGRRIVPHAGRSVLVGAVAGDALGIDLLHALRAGRFEDVRAPIDEKPALAQIVLVYSRCDPRDRQAPGVLYLVVELDAILMSWHVVQHHRHGHRVVEIVAIVLLGSGSPGRRIGEAPIDRQRNADARAGDVAAADEAARGLCS